MVRHVKYVKSKLLKTAVLLESNSLKQYVPDTRRLSSEDLLEMLKRYNMVYVKPDTGRYGQGVMKIEMLSTDQDACFRLYLGCESRGYTSHQGLFAAVDRLTESEAYIVQQGINVLTHQDRPFDIRVMVQLSPARQWETTGYLARVAAPQRVVTNFHSGGTARELKPILTEYMARVEATHYISRLSRLGENVALHCHRSFPYLQDIGLDIAIDKVMKPWILEVNTRPLADVFKKLPNKHMYRTMCDYARAYGRLPRHRPIR